MIYKVNKKIELFKIFQRIIMMILNVIIIGVLIFVGKEMKMMRYTIDKMSNNVIKTVESINTLEQTLKNSIWF